MKNYIILSAGRGGDFGSCSIVNEHIWNFLQHHDIEYLSHDVIEELKEYISHDDPDLFVEELDFISSFQEFHCFLSNLAYDEKYPNFGKHFSTLTEMVNYCVKNNIEIEDTSFDD